jgi:uncharacterized peroxidase-related enzyme
MTRITPVPREDVEDVLKDALERQQELLGLVPESLLTMAHRPRMAALFAQLASECLEPGSLDRGLKQLVAYVASATTGCRYCQAHTAQSADMVGVEQAKLDAAFEFETSGLFGEAERATLRLARDAALVPNGVTDAHFDELKRHYSEEQIAEIVGVIALFGWLNRWNDTMATTLESSPLRWASEHLAADVWEPGKHASARAT